MLLGDDQGPPRVALEINFGQLSDEEGDPNGARGHFEQAERLAKGCGYVIGEALGLMHQGKILVEASKLAAGHTLLGNAEDTLMRAMRLFKIQGDRIGICLCHIALADQAQQDKRKEIETRHIDRANGIATRAQLAGILRRLEARA